MNKRVVILAIIGGINRILKFIRRHKWIQLAINGLLLGLLVYSVYNYLNRDWMVIRQLSIRVEYSNLFISLAFYGLNYCVFIACWHFLVGLFNVDSSFCQNSYIYSISQIGKLLPTPAWFISGRLIKYQENGIPKKTIFTATILEAALHFLVGGVILGLMQIDQDKPITWLAVLSIVPLLLIARFPQTLNFKDLGIIEGKFTTKGVALIISLFIITWLMALPYFYFLTNSIAIHGLIPAFDGWRVWMISSLVSYVAMFTLGGIGLLREFSLTVLLGPYVSPPIALIIAALSRILITAGNLVFPLIHILSINLYGRLSKRST